MKDFLYFLTLADGRCYTVKNGVVTTVPNPTPLASTPDGWQDVAIAWERDMKRLGTVRNFSLPLGFVNDGAKILRHIIYTEGYEAKVYLLIKRFELTLTDTHFFPLHKYLYKGELDLSTFKDEEEKVTCAIMEGGVSKKLKANEGTTYEIPIAEKSIRVLWEGLLLEGSRNFVIADWEMDREQDNGFHNIGIYNTTQEGSAPGLATFDVTADRGASEQPESGDTRYWLSTTQAIAGIKISGTIRVSTPTVVPYKVWLYSNTGKKITIFSSVTPGGWTIVSYDINYTLNSEAGENWFLIGQSGTNTNNSKISYWESSIKLEFKSAYRNTFIRCNKPSDVFGELVKNITGEEGRSRSDLIGRFDHLCLLSGDAIRGLPNSKIKTSLNQFYDFCRVTMGAGMGIQDEQVRVENYNHFLKPDNPVHLGNAKELKVSLATDLIGNTLKIGYNEQSTDDVNGKYAFNNTHTYTSDITRVTKEINMVCPYYADCYQMEITRINLGGKTTTDNSSDNTVYILNVDIHDPHYDDDGVFYLLKRNTYEVLEGVPNATVFNIEDLTPKRLTVPQTEYLGSVFYHFNGKAMRFRTTEKNAALKTEWMSPIASFPVVFDEDADLTIPSFKMFLPYYFEFDTEVPTNLVQVMEENPNTAFSFDWNGQTFTGFLIRGGFAPSTRQQQAFKLLAAPSTDLTKLI